MFNTNDEEYANNLLESFRQKLQLQRGKEFVILLIGRTGVGKSSTINSLMGKEVAVVGDYEPTTMRVEPHVHVLNDDIKFRLFDTPGLCDDLEEVGNDYKYLEQMRSNIKRVDSMWFVSRLDDKRVTGDEKRGIKLISEAFGSEIWKQAVIIFTFAGSVDSSKYPIALRERTRLIREEIAEYTGIQISNNIPSVAVDNTKATTPDGKKWLGELYTQVYARMSENGAASFFLATVQRIRSPEKEKEIVYVPRYEASPPQTIDLDERQAEIVRRKTAQVLDLAVGAGAIGVAIGAIAGPVGAAIGGAVGAAIGFFAGWFSK